MLFLPKPVEGGVKKSNFGHKRKYFGLPQVPLLAVLTDFLLPKAKFCKQCTFWRLMAEGLGRNHAVKFVCWAYWRCMKYKLRLIILFPTCAWRQHYDNSYCLAISIIMNCMQPSLEPWPFSLRICSTVADPVPMWAWV